MCLKDEERVSSQEAQKQPTPEGRADAELRRTRKEMEEDGKNERRCSLSYLYPLLDATLPEEVSAAQRHDAMLPRRRPRVEADRAAR